MTLEVGKFYVNTVGNKCKCVKIEEHKATIWVLVEIPETKWFKLKDKIGKEDLIRRVSAMIVQDLRYSYQYKEIADEQEIWRLSRIFERQVHGVDKTELTKLYERLKKIDKELSQRNVRLLIRPFEAFKNLCPEGGVMIAPLSVDEYDDFEGPNLFKKIGDWYEMMYGKEMYLNPKIGEKPIKIRGHTYYFKYPVVYGAAEVNILQCIQNITPELAKLLPPQELEHIKKEFQKGYEAFRSISTLDNAHSFFKKEARELIDRGLSDIYSSVSVLKETKDYQLPVFIAQQAVEKFLKAFLIQSGRKNINEVKSYSHRILDALEECARVNPKFQSIRHHVNHLNLKDMSIRYANTGHTEDDAIKAIDSMLQACKFIVESWFPEN